jgi:tRNA threonylcarbamoyladenosine biosynthesis protein TsaB
MNVFAIDTTTKFLCIGLQTNTGRYEYRVEVGIKLSQALIPTVKRVLSAAGLEIGGVDYFVAGIGPGSFTAVRIGLASVKAFAWGLQKPVAGVCTLDILAAGARREGIVVPMIDAKRSLFYSAVYRKNAAGLKRLSPYVLLPRDALIGLVSKKVASSKKSTIIITGDGVPALKDACIASFPGVVFLDKDAWYPQPRPLLELGTARIAAKEFVHPFKLEPVYLYPQDCQVRR